MLCLRRPQGSPVCRPAVPTERRKLLRFLAVSFSVIVSLATLPANADPVWGDGNTVEVVRLSEKGVTPDDGKDDLPAIQAALDGAAEWTHFELPAGACEISGTVRMRARMRLTGPQKGGKAVVRFTGTASAPMIEAVGASDLSLENLVLDGADNPMAAQGVAVSDASNVEIRGLEVRDFTAAGGFGPHGVFFSAKVTHSAITGCLIENISPENPWGAGIRIAKGSSDNVARGNTIRNTGRGGILCNESHGLRILENTVEGSHGEGLGIELWGGCPNSLVENNIIDHWLSVDKSPLTAIRNNRIGDRSGAVKYIGLELVDSSDCVFTGNVVDGGQQIGVSVSNTGPKERVYWARNTLRNCITWNAQIQGETGGATAHVFRRNVFEGSPANDPRALYPNQGFGFRLNGNCRDLLLLENTITGNGGGGIQTCGENLSGLRYVGNIITGNLGPAVSGGLGEGAFWKGNTLQDNGGNTHPEARDEAGMFEIEVTAPAEVAEGVKAAFSCRAKDGETSLAHVLWDFGQGLPATGSENSLLFQRLPPGPLRVTVLAWDKEGNAAVADVEVRRSGDSLPH